MNAERAIELLSGGVRMPDAPHSAAELDEACRLAARRFGTRCRPHRPPHRSSRSSQPVCPPAVPAGARARH